MKFVNVIPRKPDFHRIVCQSTDACPSGYKVRVVVERGFDDCRRETLDFTVPEPQNRSLPTLVLSLCLSPDTGWYLQYEEFVVVEVKEKQKIKVVISPS